LRLSRAHRAVDLGSRPFRRAKLRGTAGLGKRSGGLLHGLALTLILAECGEPQLLLVALRRPAIRAVPGCVRNMITANASVIRKHQKACARRAAHSESAPNLLLGNESKFADFSG